MAKIDAKMLERLSNDALETQKKAYAPYSGYHVGAALLTEKGNVYHGCNVENGSYGATICAERNAITTAIAEEGNMTIEAIAVATEGDNPGPPCAICLQVMTEFARPDTEVYLLTPSVPPKRLLFKELLPHAFLLKDHT